MGKKIVSFGSSCKGLVNGPVSSLRTQQTQVLVTLRALIWPSGLRTNGCEEKLWQRCLKLPCLISRRPKTQHGCRLEIRQARAHHLAVSDCTIFLFVQVVILENSIFFSRSDCYAKSVGLDSI